MLQLQLIYKYHFYQLDATAVMYVATISNECLVGLKFGKFAELMPVPKFYSFFLS